MYALCLKRWRNLLGELLSHIMGTSPILEMARAYGLRPWFIMAPDSTEGARRWRTPIGFSSQNPKSEYENNEFRKQTYCGKKKNS